MTMLMITVAGVAFVKARKDVADWMIKNWWLEIVALVIGAILMISIFCCRKTCARKVPINYILLITFTVVWSYAVAGCCKFFAVEKILIAAAMTLAMFVGLTVYAIFAKAEQINCCIAMGIALGFAIWPMFILGFLFPTGPFYWNLLYLLIILATCAYIVWDTYVILNYLTTDEYIIGALILYVDLI